VLRFKSLRIKPRVGAWDRTIKSRRFGGNSIWGRVRRERREEGEEAHEPGKKLQNKVKCPVKSLLKKALMSGKPPKNDLRDAEGGEGTGAYLGH